MGNGCPKTTCAINSGITSVSLSPSRKRLLQGILVLVAVVLVVELVRDTFRIGDFQGYIEVGKLALVGHDIYVYGGNTWPPFFSVFGIVLALLELLIGPQVLRFIWLAGSVAAFCYTVALTVRLFLSERIRFRATAAGGVPYYEPLIVVPLLISLRFVMDNMANVQINLYLLLCTVLMLHCFFRKKHAALGFLLALTISMKVLTVFLLLYFVFKRDWKPVLWTVVFLGAINLLSAAVFGWEQAADYYAHWVNEVVPKGYMANHKNQSIFGAFLRLFTAEDPKHDMYINFLSLAPEVAKKLTYAVVAVPALVVAFLFRKAGTPEKSRSRFLEFSLVVTVIPLLSPVSWKAYFVFLWVPYFLLYLLLFRTPHTLPQKTLTMFRTLYWASVVLNVGSSALFWPKHYFRLWEAWSFITVGTTLLVVLQIFLIMHQQRFGPTPDAPRHDANDG